MASSSPGRTRADHRHELGGFARAHYCGAIMVRKRPNRLDEQRMPTRPGICVCESMVPGSSSVVVFRAQPVPGQYPLRLASHLPPRVERHSAVLDIARAIILPADLPAESHTRPV
jgi:hypothetical protein